MRSPEAHGRAMRRRSLLAAAATTACAVASSQAAEPGPVVIELFTSQGCNSCPRADAALARLAGRPDVLPLAFHVTYWDRLGWRDTLGDARFDARQRWYAGRFGSGAYTPQAVVAGEIDLVGSDSRLEEAIDIVRRNRMPASIAIDDGATAILPALDLAGEVRLTALAFDSHHRVAIGRGENAGREIDYVNAVRSLADLGGWDGRERRVALGAVAAGGRALALLAQEPATGRIVAVGRSAA